MLPTVRLRDGDILLHSALLTWFGSFSQSDYGRRFYLGGRIGGLAPAR